MLVLNSKVLGGLDFATAIALLQPPADELVVCIRSECLHGDSDALKISSAHPGFEEKFPQTVPPKPQAAAATEGNHADCVSDDDEEVVSLLDAAVQRPTGVNIGKGVDVIHTRPTGNSKQRALRKLRADAPELHDAPVDSLGWTLGDAEALASQHRLTLTFNAGIYSLESPIFGLAHHQSLSAAVSAIKTYARMAAARSAP